MRKALTTVGLVALLATAAACGSRVPPKVLAAHDITAISGGGRSSGPVGAQAADASTGSRSPGAATGSTGGGAGDVGATAAPRAGSADQAQPGSQPAPAPGAAASTSAPCAAASTEKGVTASAIHVASIVTDSGPLPGATEGSFRGAASYFAMVNAQGGVCGRQIVLDKGDDGLDPNRARSEFLRLEPKVLAFVGAFAVADSGYIDLIKSTGVPYVSTSVDPSGSDLHEVVPKAARDRVNTAPFAWWKQQHPDVTKTAFLYADVGGVRANTPGYRAALTRVGFKTVYDHATSVTATDYTPEVIAMRSNDVGFVYAFSFEVNMHVRLVRSMRQQNFDPPIRGANIAYNNRFSDLLGSTGDGWENPISYQPFLDPSEAKSSPALATFLQANERSFPGGQLDLFPVSGWADAAYFVQAIQRLKGPITRASLLDALYQIHSIDGDGMGTTGALHVDPSTGLGDKCFIMAEHTGGHWKREYPDHGFACDLGEIYTFK